MELSPALSTPLRALEYTEDKKVNLLLIVSGSFVGARKAGDPDAIASGRVGRSGCPEQAISFRTSSPPHFAYKRSLLSMSRSTFIRLNVRDLRVSLSPLRYLNNLLNTPSVHSKQLLLALCGLRNPRGAPQKLLWCSPRSLKIPCATGAADANASYYWR